MIIEIPDEYFNKEELENTPNRYKRFFAEWKKCDEVTFTTFPSKNLNEIIIVKDIDFNSLCAHHLLPFRGIAHVGYIPDDKIVGLSKIARIIDKFACRPQLQEILTQQIADYLEEQLKPKGLIIVMKAQHECMCIRGVKKINSQTITSAIKGIFLKPDAGKDPKSEFFELLKV